MACVFKEQLISRNNGLNKNKQKRL
jgi:hypothetical protein